jgi:hypothetical protein
VGIALFSVAGAGVGVASGGGDICGRLVGAEFPAELLAGDELRTGGRLSAADLGAAGGNGVARPSEVVGAIGDVQPQTSSTGAVHCGVGWQQGLQQS